MLNWVNRKFAKNPKRYIYLILLILLIFVIIAVEPRKESHGFIDWLQEQFGKEDADEVNDGIIGDNEEKFGARDAAGAAADAAITLATTADTLDDPESMLSIRTANEGTGGEPTRGHASYGLKDIRDDTYIKLMGTAQRCLEDDDCGQDIEQNALFCLSGELAHDNEYSAFSTQYNGGSTVAGALPIQHLTCRTLDWQALQCQQIVDAKQFLIAPATANAVSKFCMMKRITTGHDEPIVCGKTVKEDIRKPSCTGLQWLQEEDPENKSLPLPRDLFAFYLAAWPDLEAIYPSTGGSQKLRYNPKENKMPKNPGDGKTHSDEFKKTKYAQWAAIEVFPYFQKATDVDYTPQIWHIRNGLGGLFFRLDEDNKRIVADGCGASDAKGLLTNFDPKNERFQFEIRKYKQVDMTNVDVNVVPNHYYTIRSVSNDNLLVYNESGYIEATSEWKPTQYPTSDAEALSPGRTRFYFTPRERKIDPSVLSFWSNALTPGVDQATKLSDLSWKKVILKGSRDRFKGYCDAKANLRVGCDDGGDYLNVCDDCNRQTNVTTDIFGGAHCQPLLPNDSFKSYRMRCNSDIGDATKFQMRREFDDWFSIRIVDKSDFKETSDYPYCAATHKDFDKGSPFRCAFNRDGDLQDNAGTQVQTRGKNEDQNKKLTHVLIRPKEAAETGKFTLEYNWHGYEAADNLKTGFPDTEKEQNIHGTRKFFDPWSDFADGKHERNKLRDTWHSVSLYPHRRNPEREGPYDGEYFSIIAAPA